MKIPESVMKSSVDWVRIKLQIKKNLNITERTGERLQPVLQCYSITSVTDCIRRKTAATSPSSITIVLGTAQGGKTAATSPSSTTIVLAAAQGVPGTPLVGDLLPQVVPFQVPSLKMLITSVQGEMKYCSTGKHLHI